MIRRARPEDVPAIQGLIRELARYEREPDAVVSTEDDLRAVLFPAEGTATTYAHVAEETGHDGGTRVVGTAVWFLTYSTWTGRNGIWLEDLFVLPEARGAGHGTGLLAALAAECVERGFARLDWSVLDWNEPSIGFYRSIGAVGMDDWTQQRLSGDALAALARRAADRA